MQFPRMHSLFVVLAFKTNVSCGLIPDWLAALLHSGGGSRRTVSQIHIWVATPRHIPSDDASPPQQTHLQHTSYIAHKAQTPNM